MKLLQDLKKALSGNNILIPIAVVTSIAIVVSFFFVLYRWLIPSDFSFPTKYFVLLVALLGLFLLWNFFLKKKSYRISSPSKISFTNDWWVKRIIIVFFILAGFFAVRFIKNSEWQFKARNSINAAFSKAGRKSLQPRNTTLLKADVAYNWTRLCETEYYFDLVAPGEHTVLTYRMKDYPDRFLTIALRNNDGYPKYTLIDGQDPMLAGEYTVTVSRDAEIYLRVISHK